MSGESLAPSGAGFFSFWGCVALRRRPLVTSRNRSEKKGRRTKALGSDIASPNRAEARPLAGADWWVATAHGPRSSVFCLEEAGSIAPRDEASARTRDLTLGEQCFVTRDQSPRAADLPAVRTRRVRALRERRGAMSLPRASVLRPIWTVEGLRPFAAAAVCVRRRQPACRAPLRRPGRRAEAPREPLGCPRRRLHPCAQRRGARKAYRDAPGKRLLASPKQSFAPGKHLLASPKQSFAPGKHLLASPKRSCAPRNRADAPRGGDELPASGNGREVRYSEAASAARGAPAPRHRASAARPP